MLTAPPGLDVFSRFLPIMEPFQHAIHASDVYYDGLVAKMLACGQPEKMGYVEYRCLRCGQGTQQWP